MTAPDQTITVQDILDIVEGQVAPERVEIVRLALQRDPGLARHLERMVANRRGVRELVRDASGSVPRGLVAEAILRAEREALLEEAGSSRGVGAGERLDRAGGRGRRWGRRLAAMVALALLLGGAIGGAAWVLSGENESGPALLAMQSPGSGPSSSGAMRVEPYLGQPPQGTIPELPGEFADSEGLLLRRSANSSSPNRSQPDLRGGVTSVPTLPFGPGGVNISGWSEEIQRSLALERTAREGSDASRSLRRNLSGYASGSERPWERDGKDEPSLSLAEAARLAVEGRLRVVVQTRDAEAYVSQAKVYAAVGTSSRLVPAAPRAPTTPTSFVVELNARMDPDLAGVQDAIAALTQRLANDGFGPRAVVGLVASESELGVGPAGTSLLVDDVLWWSRSVSSWEWTIAVRTPVEIVSDPTLAPTGAR